MADEEKEPAGVPSPAEATDDAPTAADDAPTAAPADAEADPPSDLQADPPSDLPEGRYNTLRESPAEAKFRLAVVQFKVPGAKNGGSDKGPDGNRIDSIPIANGVIAAGGACDLILYDAEKHEEFVAATAQYDALIVRINPGQLSQGTPEGTQARFDDLMNAYIAQPWNKLVWSSPKIQTQMGAKDALVKIGKLGCGLPDTLAYYDAEALEKGFKSCCAYQPRVIKQNRGSAGEGIWLCWLAKKEDDNSLVPFTEYPAKSLQPSDDGLSVETDASLGDDDWLKLMEMNDNHVEYHTVKEFITFCVGGPEAEGAGTWTSTFPGKYLEGGKEAGGQLVDQRLLPRIEEGEVRVLMAGDTCQMAIHKKPMGGGLSAVGGNSEYTYYKPDDPKYASIVQTLYNDIPTLLPCMGLEGEPLPLLWTADYIPKNPEGWDQEGDAGDAETEYVVGEFNCSCVGISKFQAVCGGEQTLADVPDEDYFEACELTDLMGVKAIEMLERAGDPRMRPKTPEEERRAREEKRSEEFLEMKRQASLASLEEGKRLAKEKTSKSLLEAQETEAKRKAEAQDAREKIAQARAEAEARQKMLDETWKPGDERPPPMVLGNAATDKAWLDKHGVLPALAVAIAKVVRSKPQYPLRALAQLLSPDTYADPPDPVEEEAAAAAASADADATPDAATAEATDDPAAGDGELPASPAEGDPDAPPAIDGAEPSGSATAAEAEPAGEAAGTEEPAPPA